MNWDDLRHFAAALRQGTLAGAARELGCEHTTVSRRLDSLEAALGTKLFLRTPEGLVQTRAAAELAPLVEQMGLSVQAIERRVTGLDERIAGVVRLTAPEAFVGLVLHGLPELRERYPELTIEVRADDRALDLARGEADVALRLTPSLQPDLIVKKLSAVGGALYASPEYLARRGAPDPVHALAGHDLVGYGEPLAAVPAARWLAAHGAGAAVVFRGNTLLSVMGAAAAGMGLAVLPSIVAAREPRLLRLSKEVLCSGVLSLVVHPDIANVARIRAVMSFIDELVARERPRLLGA